MQTKVTTKIVIDKLKLDLLLRMGCSKEVIFDAICYQKITKTGDALLDELLECFLDVNTFKNWGGRRKGAGRKSFQLEIQDDNHLDNQDLIKMQNKNKNKNIDNNSRNNINNLSTTHENPSQDEVLEYAAQQNDMAGVGGFVVSQEQAQDFFDYYSGIGWVLPNDAKTPIVDWKPFLRKWVRNPRFKSRESEKIDIDDLEHFVI